VIGVPDPQRGEVVKALLVLNAETRLNEDRMAQFCQQHLAAHKRPRLFEAVDGELPRNFLGKLLRRHLRERPSRRVPTSMEETS